MSLSILLAICSQVVLISGVVILWVRVSKIQTQDDQRLSKGLQLLQAKLAALEDLSDRTEVQVNQLVAILEKKIKEIQSKIVQADHVISQIDLSIKKSLEVATIFQDKIPHEEIQERQYTKKYVMAAQLAHQGKTTKEISESVNLSMAEIDLIAKINKDQLQFDVSSLPEWATTTGLEPSHEIKESSIQIPTLFENKLTQKSMSNFESAFEVPTGHSTELKKLGEQFRSINQTAQSSPVLSQMEMTKENKSTGSSTFSQFFNDQKNESNNYEGKQPVTSETIVQGGKKLVIKPYLFKRIDSPDIY